MLPCYVAIVHKTPPGSGDFARVLAEIQEKAGLSYQDIADAAGVNRSQAWRWVNQGSAPTYEAVRRLAAHLLTEHPEVAEAASWLLPAAGYETPLVTAGPEGGIRSVRTLPRAADGPVLVPSSLERGDDVFPGIDPSIRPAVDREFAAIEPLVLRAMGEHPEVTIRGEWVFPGGTSDAQSWDSFTALHWTLWQRAMAVAVTRALRERDAAQGGRASEGLTALPEPG